MEIFGKWFVNTCTLELRRPRAGLSAHSIFSHVFSAYAMMAGLLVITLYVELAHHNMLFWIAKLRGVALVTPRYMMDERMDDIMDGNMDDD